MASPRADARMWPVLQTPPDEYHPAFLSLHVTPAA
eukprot:CAMPEP_0171640572 /NCGR_PEP_ID=MMETSP0990-20121206/30561_1 /TAXON_ID=483369 /ORGANISM="non described non described, Strain CCMP2098" /LENGTH=34 /DNA_ID= /DNA_START= /DNA_END= /DNA_ORIENTATION=